MFIGGKRVGGFLVGKCYEGFFVISEVSFFFSCIIRVLVFLFVKRC